MTEHGSFSITLPFTPYRVTIGTGGRERVDITKQGLLKLGDGRQWMVREGKREMKDVTAKLMKAAYWPEMARPLTMDAEVRTATAAPKDDDNLWVGLYSARDEIAKALGINDVEIVTGKVTWCKGTPERTIITLTGALREEKP